MELRRASARPCDGCRSAKAAEFCEVDAAFLCLACDAGVHGANKLASSHKRAWLCEACESTPAAFACRADAAAPCRGRALANPLAGRHVGVPLKPSFDAAAVAANCDGFRP